jgi:hypothetical protein
MVESGPQKVEESKNKKKSQENNFKAIILF